MERPHPAESCCSPEILIYWARWSVGICSERQDPGPRMPCMIEIICYAFVIAASSHLLSGMPDLFDRNKILSGGDLSHYQVPHCIRVFFFFCVCLFITILNFILNYVPIETFWIFTYHKIWILLIIFCFIWNYWIIYFLTCLEVCWSVVS